MTFVNLIIFCFACGGLTYIVVFSKIAKKPREWLSSKSDFFRQLLKCCLCAGTWVGAFIYIIGCLSDLFQSPLNILTVLIFAFAGALVSYIFCVLFGDEGLNISGAQCINDDK